MDTQAGILYLNRHEVEQICQQIDSVAAMRELFQLHGTGQTILPDEAYLGWTNSSDEQVRSLNMPGYIGGSLQIAGTKIINGNIKNSLRGLPRASGLTLLFDEMSTRILSIMEGAYISSLRTASVSTLAIEELMGNAIHQLAIIGAGVLAEAHIDLLVKRLSQLHQLLLFDIDENRRKDLERRINPLLQAHNIEYIAMSSAEEAIRQAQVIVPVTTTTTGYIHFDWLQPGAILVNVSLDDILPEVALRADLVVVDDWNLVKNDDKRLLGRMYRQGHIAGPDDVFPRGTQPYRKIDAQLGDIVAGNRKGRRTPDDIILVNPFGLAIEDIALASRVYQIAQAGGLGLWLER